MSISSTKPFLLIGIVEMDTERGELLLMGGERCISEIVVNGRNQTDKSSKTSIWNYLWGEFRLII
jgi:hypothetical protein